MGKPNSKLLLPIAFVILVLLSSPLERTVLPARAAPSKPPQYVEEFSVLTPNAAPLAITVDRNGIVWFTESNATKLGRFDATNRSFTEYNIPGVGDMWGVTLDGGGNVWFTQYSGKGSVSPGGAFVTGGHGRLGRFNPDSESFRFVDVPTNGSFPMRIISDQHDGVWFTEFLGNKIGRYDPSTPQLSEYTVPTNQSGPSDLTFDDNGMLWFTESYARKVGEFDPANRSFREYPLGAETPPEVVGSPVGIGVDKNGHVWVADHGGNWILELNPLTGRSVHIPTHIPPADVYPISIPNGLTIDRNGGIWFTEHGGNSIAHFDPSTQTMVEFPIPTGPLSTALWLALAPNNEVWFAEWSTDKIGVVHTNLPVGLAVHSATRRVTVPAGGQVQFTLVAESSQALEGNGTWEYSWSSYNPNDVLVDFSTQYPSFAPSNFETQALLKVSDSTPPGNYTLSMGMNAGSFRVWTIISVEVVQAGSQNGPVTTYVVLLVLAILGLAMAIVMKRRSHPTYEDH
jgi:virginiamycin B lyase